MSENNNKPTILKWYDDDNEEVNVEISSKEKSKINDKIENFIQRVYSKFGYIKNNNKDKFEINKKSYEMEIINKFINNKRTFESIAKFNDIRTEESFIKYMKYNLFNQYHYNGVFFIGNYHIVECTSNKGKRGENLANIYFQNFINNNNKTKKIIKFNPPINIAEDVSGIDGSFMFDNEKYTVQVKPFSSQKRTLDDVIFESAGILKFDTHYLVLYNEKKINYNYSYDIIIISNGRNKNCITIDGYYYKTNCNYIKEEIYNIRLE